MKKEQEKEKRERWRVSDKEWVKKREKRIVWAWQRERELKWNEKNKEKLRGGAYKSRKRGKVSTCDVQSAKETQTWI